MKTIIDIKETIKYTRSIIVENATEETLEELEDFVCGCDSMDDIYHKILELDMNIIEYADRDMNYPDECELEYDYDYPDPNDD